MKRNICQAGKTLNFWSERVIMSQRIAVPVQAARHNAQMRSSLQGLTRRP